MADDEDGGDAAQVESEPQAAGGVVSNPILMTRTKSSVELQDLADVEEGEYVVGWKTIRGMIALHVSLSTDMVRMYNMQMNRAQKVVAFTLAFVYGMGQVARNAATFGQAAFCTDTRLQETPFTADTTATMLALIGVAFGLGKAIWGPMLDKYDPRMVYLLLMAAVNLCTFAFTYVTNLNIIIAIFTLSGFMQSGLYPGTTAMTARWFGEEQQGRVFALRGVGSRLGTIMSSWVVGGLLTVFEWPTAVRGAALLSCGGLAVGWILQKHPDELETACSCLKDGKAEVAAGTDEDGEGVDDAEVSDEVDPDSQSNAQNALEASAPTSPPFMEWFSESRFWLMNVVQITVNVLMGVEAMTPVFVNAVLKPPTWVSALVPSCVSIGIVFSITVCGAILEKKNAATRHILTTAMLAGSTLTCFVMFALVAYISASDVCTTEEVVATPFSNSSIEVISLTNSSCVTPASIEGYAHVDEDNLEASSLFNVSAGCDTDKYFTGSANASMCSADGEEYLLSGCEYNSCVEKQAVASSGPVETCENPWHGSMSMVIVFSVLFVFLGIGIGYAIYVPPFAFICQFAGPNVGTMSSLYAVSGAIGSMLYLAAYSTIVSSSAGWYGVWLLMTILSAISTAAMAGFTMMDLQAGEEFKGGRFDDAELTVLFKRIDVNGDGIVDKDELTEFLLGTFDGRALPRPGVSGNRPRGNQVASEVKRMMAEADPTGELGKKAISFPAFKNVVSVGHPSCLHSIFDYIDTEFSIDSPKGEMHVSDLKHAFAFLGFDVRAPLVVQQILAIVEFSQPKDTISKEDFVNHMLPLMHRSTTCVDYSQQHTNDVE